MIKYDIGQIFPRFLLNDHTGYAMAKAINAGLGYFLKRCEDGLNTLQDPDKMPEWRLDEMAWEYNCLYDYDADINSKRGWIRNANQYYQHHGTPEGIKQYLGAFFGSAEIDEWFEKEGLEPGYFDVVVTGARSVKNEAWIRSAVERAKNVRSLLNNIIYNGGESDVTIKSNAAFAGLLVTYTCRMIEE